MPPVGDCDPAPPRKERRRADPAAAVLRHCAPGIQRNLGCEKIAPDDASEDEMMGKRVDWYYHRAG